MWVARVSVAVLALCVHEAAGHGYVRHPPSRSALCGTHLTPYTKAYNTGCGAGRSAGGIEGVDVYRTGPEFFGAPDGTWSGAGKDNLAALNEQSPTRWAKNAMTSGKNIFTWVYTAPHRTLDWKYYITKQGWDQNKPVGSWSLEAEPFCFIHGGFVQTPTEQNHECTVPERHGYHVILAIWDVSNTERSFFQAIDVVFGDDSECTSLEREYNECMGLPVPPPVAVPETLPLPQEAQPTDLPLLRAMNQADAAIPQQCERFGFRGEGIHVYTSCAGNEGCCGFGLECRHGSCRYPL